MKDPEIRLEKAETHAYFYVAVSYYAGVKPFCVLYENRTDINSDSDTVFKIRVPYKIEEEE